MKYGIEKYGRALLTAAIVAGVVLLLGSDFPEHERENHDARSVAAELCRELEPELRRDFAKTVAENPVRLLRLCAE